MSPTCADDPGPAGARNHLLAIIGGSGRYKLTGLTDPERVTLPTPWGAPPARLLGC